MELWGLADMFIKLGIKYGGKESIDLIHKIGHTMVNEALRQSALLAEEYGPFPRYNREAILSSPFLLDNATEEVLELIKEYGVEK